MLAWNRLWALSIYGHTPTSPPTPRLPTPVYLIFSPLLDQDNPHSQILQLMFLPPTYFYGRFLKHRTKFVIHLLKTKENPKYFILLYPMKCIHGPS